MINDIKLIFMKRCTILLDSLIEQSEDEVLPTVCTPRVEDEGRQGTKKDGGLGGIVAKEEGSDFAFIISSLIGNILLQLVQYF